KERGMNSRQLMAGAVGLAMTFLVAGAQVAPASVIASFDNNTDGNPFRTSLVNGGTSAGGELTDPDFNGGTAFTVTIANPRTGVDITTAASPDFTKATTRTFGA